MDGYIYVNIPNLIYLLHVLVIPNEKRRKVLWNMEMEAIAVAAKNLMESVSHVRAPLAEAKHLEHVKPMFKV